MLEANQISPDTHALFFDLDGTLVELANTPDGVSFKEGIPQMLQQLYTLYQGALAIITGRSLSSLTQILSKEGLAFPQSGQHGFEFQFTPHDKIILDAHYVKKMRPYLSGLQKIEKQFPGSFLEDKGVCIGIHFRNKPEADETIRSYMEKIIQTGEGKDLKIQAGHYIYELRPNTSHKGHAIAEFLKRPPFQGKIPLFIGDDLTDEDGFETVNKLDGISIHVGMLRNTKANYRIKDVDDVHNLLRSLLDSCSTQQQQKAS